MAEAKNSNFSNLTEVINTNNAKADAQNIFDDIEGSIDTPSDYTMLNEELFGESSVSSDEDSTSMSSTKTRGKVKIKQQKQSDIEEESESDDYEGSEEEENESSSESSMNFNDPVTSGVKGIVNLNVPSKSAKSTVEKNHVELMNKIEENKESLIRRGIPVPHHKTSKVKKDFKYATEVNKALSDLLDDNVGADNLVSSLNFVLKIICAIFNGRHELAGYKLDLRGYNVAVISDLKDMRSDTVALSSYIRKKIGKDAMKLFLFIKIFIVNAGTTIWNNNSTPNTTEAFGDDSDEEDEEDFEEEEEEEEE